MSDKIETVRKFFGSIDAAVKTKDPVLIQELLCMLAEDIRYQNKPMRVIVGLADFLNWFLEFAACEDMHCDIIRIAADGDWVLTERRDSWTMHGYRFSMDMMGTLEVRDGQIHTWVDFGTDKEQWEASGTMPNGFFTRWADDALTYEKV